MMKTLILFLCLAFQAPAALAAPDHDCPCMTTQTCEMDMQKASPQIAPLDEGIREVVALVRELGFETVAACSRTKSADPYVVMTVEPDCLVDLSRGLAEQLEQCGVEVEMEGSGGVWVQATFDPRSIRGKGVIMLGGLNDEGLREARSSARERGRRDAAAVMRALAPLPKADLS